jgi:excisionase family DNA binding protein
LRVSRNRIYQLIADGAIPHLRFGRTIRIPAEGLERWIEQQTAQGGQDR